MIANINRLLLFLPLSFSMVLLATEGEHSPYTLQPAPLADVNITDQFWAPKMEINRR